MPAGREPSGGERGEREKGKGKKVEEVEESLFGFVWFLQEKVCFSFFTSLWGLREADGNGGK